VLKTVLLVFSGGCAVRDLNPPFLHLIEFYEGFLANLFFDAAGGGWCCAGAIWRATAERTASW
jgi:hypothetical protein